jgi:hypothetical protein
MDVKNAIEELQSRNTVFEERFVSLEALQTAVQELVFNRQRPVVEENKEDQPRVNSVSRNPLQHQPSRF